MKLLNLSALLFLASYCEAGPLVAIAIPALTSVFSEAAVAGVMGTVGSWIGMGANAVWFGQYVVVNGALYYGSLAAPLAGGALVGGAVGGGIKGAEKVKDDKEAKSIMASISSASLASVASVSSVNSVRSSMSASHVSVSSALHVSSSAARASADSLFASQSHRFESNSLDPFDFATIAKRTTAPATTAAPTSVIPPPPGTPVSTLPPDQRPKFEVPPGVNEYNFRMCQYDIILMGQNKQMLLFDQPAAQSVRVDNVPSTCMVLANFMVGDPALGPHPVPMGAASLQWNDIHPDTIELIRLSFGLPANTTVA